MKHPIFSALDDFGLNDLSKLHSKITQMRPQDFEALLDHLESGYRQSPFSLVDSKESFQPITFGFPSLPAKLLGKVSSYVLVSERVLLDDPLFDYLAEMVGGIESITSSAKEIRRELRNLTVPISKENIEETIRFYIRSREVIDENQLVPYKRLKMPQSFPVVLENLKEMIASNPQAQKELGLTALATAFSDLEDGGTDDFATLVIKRTLGYSYLLYRVATRLAPRSVKINLARKLLQSPKVVSEMKRFMTMGPYLYASLASQLEGDFLGMSTDLLSPELAFVHRLILESFSEANELILENSRYAIPGDIMSLGIEIPLLIDVPIERILEIAQQEKEAYQNFRGAMNERLLSITAPVGSKEREIQVQRIRESIAKSITEISMAHNRLYRDYSRRFLVNLAIASSSILVAGLSTISRNLDAISITGGITAGAGFVQSIKEFSKDWLAYQKELENLRSSDNYFIWKTAFQDKK